MAPWSTRKPKAGRPRAGRSVVASAAKMTAEQRRATARVSQPWQVRAWTYREIVPELHFASEFYAKGLSMLRVYVARWDAESNDWVEVKAEKGTEISPQDQKALDAWDRVQDPAGGRARLFGNYGRCRNVSGESFLVVTSEETDAGVVECWEMLSEQEIRVKSDGQYERIKAPAIKETLKAPDDDIYDPLPGEAIVYRLWRPDPRYSDLADSPFRGILDIAEELVLLTQSIRSQARSRLAGAGLFLIPQEASFGGEEDLEVTDQNGDEIVDASDDGDGAESENQLIRDLTEAALTAIANEGDASAVVPVFAEVPGDSIPMFRFMELGIDRTFPEVKLREEAVTRMARGLDMPPEELLGMADANHWTGWLIDDKTWKAHLEPTAIEMVDEFTAIYQRPALVEDGLTVEQSKGYRLMYDESGIVNNPDRSKDAKDLYDRYALSGTTLREANGFTDDDAPDDDEIARRIEIESAQTPTPATGDGSSADTTAEPPAQDATASVIPITRAGVALTRIEAMMEVARHRCLELAGNRLRTRAQKDASVTALIAGVDNEDVPFIIARDAPEFMRSSPTPISLVAGGAACLRRSLGLDEEEALKVCRQVERDAAALLVVPEPVSA